MSILLEKLLLFTTATLFSLFTLAVYYSCYWLINQSIRIFYKELPKIPITFGIFFGAIIYGMSLFCLGLLGIAFAPVVFYYSCGLVVLALVLSLVHLIRTKKYKEAYHNLLSFRPNSIHIGLFLTYIIGVFFALRPVVNFDGMWYHLVIPKYFLQTGNIAYNGEHLRYSVHPYLNFFLNMLPLSLPGLSTLIKGVFINMATYNLVFVGVASLFLDLKKRFSLHWLVNLLAPSIVFFSSISMSGLGTGYNDLYTVGISCLIIQKLIKIHTENKFTIFEFGQLALLSIMLFLFKIFFGIFAVLAMVYALYQYYIINKESLKPKSYFNIAFTVLGLCLVFVLPWVLRSYYYTGKPLAPIGLPGITEDAYNYAGSKNFNNHWGVFVYERFYNQFLTILFTVYTPAFFVGLISIFNKSISRKTGELWALGFFGFWLVYFGSIVTEWRYFLPSVTIILVLAVLSINSLFETKKFFSGVILILTLFAFIPFTYVQNRLTKTEWATKIYLDKKVSLDDFTKKLLTGMVFDYYHSPLDNRFRPKDILDNDVVMVGGLHNLAYVDNPILDNRLAIKEFETVKDETSLINLLSTKKVKFLMLKNQSLENYLFQELKLMPLSSREIFRPIIYDPEQGIQWYSVLI